MKGTETHASSSSGTARAKVGYGFNKPDWYCGNPSKVRISSKANSFDRQFYNCPNYKINKHVDFSID